MRTLRSIGGMACAFLVTGCYTLQPVGRDRLVDGNQVAFDISDAGRVALGGSMGPSIAKIEGRLVRADSGSLVVAVSSVDLISGGSQTWTGEPVRLQPGYISNSYARRFSTSRTLVASAIGIGAAVFIVTRSVVGGGTSREPEIPHDTLGTTSRGPRP